jgi:hypothetical protein
MNKLRLSIERLTPSNEQRSSGRIKTLLIPNAFHRITEGANYRKFMMDEQVR